MHRLVTFSALICLLAVSNSNAEEITAEQQQRETEFSERMSNTTLVGTFTIDSKMTDAPKAERYEIESVKKATGNLWTFTTRIKYGDVDSRLPIVVPVVWADDTPMVSLTNMSLPGLGDAFSARVIFHDDRYAGTWQHGKVGGHMFGMIVKQKAKTGVTAP